MCGHGKNKTNDFVNLKKIEEIIDKQNSIYFDSTLFDNFILNKKVEELFNLAYKDSLEYIKNLLSDSIETLLKTLNNNYLENKKYSISIGSNESLEGNLINGVYLDVLNKLDILDNLTTIYKICQH